MSYIAAAAIVGGASYLSAREARKGSKVEYGQVPETEAVKTAQARLLKLSEGKPPEIPKRKIAPLQPMTRERQLARKTAIESLKPTEQADFLSLPEVQGLIQETTVQGNLLGNRLSRMLQASGSLTSSPGRDVLGRVVTDVEKSIASVLAPFASEQRGRAFAERQRIQNLIPALEGLGLTEEERKRVFEQAGLSAEYEQEFAESQQLQTFTIPLLQSIIGLQPGVQPTIQGQQPSMLTQLEPIIGPLLTASMMKGGGGGYGPGNWNVSPSMQNAQVINSLMQTRG